MIPNSRPGRNIDLNATEIMRNNVLDTYFAVRPGQPEVSDCTCGQPQHGVRDCPPSLQDCRRTEYRVPDLCNIVSPEVVAVMNRVPSLTSCSTLLEPKLRHTLAHLTLPSHMCGLLPIAVDSGLAVPCASPRLPLVLPHQGLWTVLLLHISAGSLRFGTDVVD
jgi:hypothetical protein